MLRPAQGREHQPGWVRRHEKFREWMHEERVCFGFVCLVWFEVQSLKFDMSGLVFVALEQLHCYTWIGFQTSVRRYLGLG